MEYAPAPNEPIIENVIEEEIEYNQGVISSQVKFSSSEKGTKIWKKSPTCFDTTE